MNSGLPRSAADAIDCVNLDGWTCDFLAARRWTRAQDRPVPLERLAGGDRALIARRYPELVR